MTKHLSAIALGVASTLMLSACASSNATSEVILDSSAASGAKVEIVAEGGFAALTVTHRIEHDSRAFLFVQRHICSGTNCAAPLDSASGTLSQATTDSLFAGVLAQKNKLQDDYGRTQGGADMFDYMVRITSNGTVKTIHADDGTMPEALRQIVSAIRISVDQGRK